MVKMGGK